MLGKNGLTSSEASRVANFVKELVKSIDITVDNFKVITSIAKRGNTNVSLDNNKAIPDWDTQLKNKGDYFSLSAWLKEAIKAKERVIEQTRAEQFDSEGISLLEAPVRPRLGATDWDTFFVTQLNIKEQAEYLKHEAFAAHVGKFIHQFDKIRDQYKNFKPSEFMSISPTETLTVSNELLYTEEELVLKQEELLALHRDAERQINYYKAKHKEWEAKVNREYQISLDFFKRELSTLNSQNQAIIQKAQSAFEIEKTNKLESYAALKIEIPLDLQPILDEVYKKLN